MFSYKIQITPLKILYKHVEKVKQKKEEELRKGIINTTSISKKIDNFALLADNNYENSDGDKKSKSKVVNLSDDESDDESDDNPKQKSKSNSRSKKTTTSKNSVVKSKAPVKETARKSSRAAASKVLLLKRAIMLNYLYFLKGKELCIGRG